jgi:hypothetical protein
VHHDILPFSPPLNTHQDTQHSNFPTVLKDLLVFCALFFRITSQSPLVLFAHSQE